MTARIVEETSVTIRKEALSPFTGITWNSDNTGMVEFWVQHEVTENGTFVRKEIDTRPGMYPLTVNLNDILGRTFAVPNPDPEGEPFMVPCILLMGAIKQAFEELYSEAVAAMEPPAEDPPAE